VISLRFLCDLGAIVPAISQKCTQTALKLTASSHLRFLLQARAWQNWRQNLHKKFYRTCKPALRLFSSKPWIFSLYRLILIIPDPYLSPIFFSFLSDQMHPCWDVTITLPLIFQQERLQYTATSNWTRVSEPFLDREEKQWALLWFKEMQISCGVFCNWAECKLTFV